jgi:hypothetical protein
MAFENAKFEKKFKIVYHPARLPVLCDGHLGTLDSKEDLGLVAVLIPDQDFFVRLVFDRASPPATDNMEVVQHF